MAEYDRRGRPGCSWNYVDAHDEIWEAVQHEPARFTAEVAESPCSWRCAVPKWSASWWQSQSKWNEWRGG